MNAKGRRDPKQLWIDELKAVGFKPEIFKIEEVPVAQAKESEDFWIGYFRGVGADLTNVDRLRKNAMISAGGRAHYRLEGARQKTAAATRRRYQDPAERQRTRDLTKAARSTPESRAKTSAQMKARWSDPEQHRKQSERIRQWWAMRKTTGGVLNVC